MLMSPGVPSPPGPRAMVQMGPSWRTLTGTAAANTLTGDARNEIILGLDGNDTLGGDNGLRGYPERWAGGEGFTRLSLEQRFYTDAYLWRIFRVGGAVFMDVGRTWGDDPLGAPNPGTLADVGFGLRLGKTRSAFARVIHVDLAFPLDGDPSLKRVELVIEARREF